MSISVLPFPAGKPSFDLLEQPPVSIWIAERGEAQVGASFRVRARNRFGRARAVPPLVEDLADLDAAAHEVLAGHLDVRDGELQTLNGAGLGGGEPGPERNRALRMGGR